MTLQELSLTYEAAAVPLRKRLRELRIALAATEDPEEIWHIKRRIAELTPMLTEMNDLAEITARYYEPGYYRIAKYSSNCFDDPITKHGMCAEYAASTSSVEKEIEK